MPSFFTSSLLHFDMTDEGHSATRSHHASPPWGLAVQCMPPDLSIESRTTKYTYSPCTSTSSGFARLLGATLGVL